MAAVGGPIVEISIGGRTFPVAQDSEVNVDLGGRKTELQMNGDSSHRKVQEIKPWMITNMDVSIDTTRGDQEFLQNIVDVAEDVVVAITYITGTVYSGTGIVLNDLEYNAKNSTMPVELGGGGILVQQ